MAIYPLRRWMKRSDVERFWEKVDIRGENECWPWKAARNWAGYGVFQFFNGNSKNTGAHRFSLMLALGHPLPVSKNVIHSCDNPCCVNPRHLRLGTQLDNVHDAMERGRHSNPPVQTPGQRAYEKCLRGSKIGTAKLNEEIVRSLLAERLKGRNFVHLGREFGIDPSVATDICAGRAWAHVPGTYGAPTLAELAAVPVYYNHTPPEKHGNRKLTDKQVAEIRASPLGPTALAKQFGVGKAQVSKIKLGQARR